MPCLESKATEHQYIGEKLHPQKEWQIENLYNQKRNRSHFSWNYNFMCQILHFMIVSSIQNGTSHNICIIAVSDFLTELLDELPFITEIKIALE